MPCSDWRKQRDWDYIYLFYFVEMITMPCSDWRKQRDWDDFTRNKRKENIPTSPAPIGENKGIETSNLLGNLFLPNHMPCSDWRKQRDWDIFKILYSKSASDSGPAPIGENKGIETIRFNQLETKFIHGPAPIGENKGIETKFGPIRITSGFRCALLRLEKTKGLRHLISLLILSNPNSSPCSDWRKQRDWDCSEI